MKILECSDSFLPIVDGVGRVVYQYAKHLSEMGNECYVVTPLAKSGYRGSYPFEIVDFLSMKVPVAKHYQTGIAQLDPHYNERIGNITPDIIHAHTPAFSGIEALRLAEKNNVPLVGTFHSKYYYDFLRITHSSILATVGSRYVAEFYSRCDEVWTVSEDAAGELKSYGYKGDIFIMQNGTEIKKPKLNDKKKAMEEFGLNEAEKNLLYVGQIDFKKNLKMTIEAAGILKRRGRNFKLIFAGMGQDAEALRKLADSEGLGSSMLFTGHISDPSLLDGLYMASDLFVFPSLYDTAGLVVREAAVMGTPSVVVENTAPAEVIIDGVNGLVCQNTAESLADTMEAYLFESEYEEQVEISQSARKSIPLRWEDVIKKAGERYSFLVDKGRKPKKVFFAFSSLMNQEQEQ